ncbi:type II secretion system F family protein [Pseudomonas sp. LJDD11]|uniref:type II secretion system F family protein n=1 Tax=Pseudomonas sp. LJDD11 TaxID=2931984 RepID=UPI00211C98F5|nr:type II secretion system F family protein [Pseudomonas sp. LJDD11]MCQ9427200.1 type II secretion system F family protein [Pseudomonas sp. LJDD11]
MQATLDLVTLMIFICTLCVVYGLLGLSKRRQRAQAAEQRLAQLKLETAPPAANAGVIEDMLLELQNTPLAGVPILGDALARLWMQLGLLGWHHNLRTRVLVMAMAGGLLGVLMGRDTPMPGLFVPLIGIAASVALFVLLLRQGLAKHHKALQLSLPQAIDALNRTCRAGVPVSNAFSLVAEHLTGPLATEFLIIDHWLRLGVPLRRVMKESALRVPLAEYRFFAVILIINQESGGRLGETLDRLASTLRERHELQLKILAKTSEARASAKIVAALVPCMMLYMYFNAPADFRFLLSDPTGNKVLIYVLSSVILGLSIIQLMVRRVR